MKRIINHRDFNVFKLEKTIWDIDYHNHNFYEIIVIEDGKGNHRLNEVTFSYNKGDVFLLRPSDAHEFIITKKTKFIYIKFTNQFIADVLLWNSSLKNKQSIDDLFLQNSNHYESLIKDDGDKKHFHVIATLLLSEFENHKSYSSEITFQLFLNLVFLFLRNSIKHPIFLRQQNTNKVEQLLSYISINALHPQKMKISYLAKEFSMSEKYISIYIKAQTGLSIQNHVTQIKLKAAEKLLKKSSFNINEISHKLGFNDASHFNKFFKKYKKVSPSAFQKKK